MRAQPLCRVLLAGLIAASAGVAPILAGQEPSGRLEWTRLPDLPDAAGVAGAFAGASGGALVIAGGANFPSPVRESEKTWRDRVWVLVEDDAAAAETQRAATGEEKEESFAWIEAAPLPRPVAYGASVSTGAGIVCIGGCDRERTFSDVFVLRWDPATRSLERTEWPPLPAPVAHAAAAEVGGVIYVTGGTRSLDLESATSDVWALDLSLRPRRSGETPAAPGAETAGAAAPGGSTESPSDGFRWRPVLPWPGPSRAFHIATAQHNGHARCLYVISGRRAETGAGGESAVRFLTDLHEFDPSRYDPRAYDPATGEYSGTGRFARPWRRRADVPACVMAGPAAPAGQSHIFVLGGDDGALFAQGGDLRDGHPGFPRRSFAYHTITDTWIDAGPTPANHVTAAAVEWRGSIVIPSGEIRPRVRSPAVWRVSLRATHHAFGALNFTALFVYLAAMVAVGFYFARRQGSTNDYFRGGQRIPWWAAACSIFATMLSSITFMAIPAKAFATDWVYLVGHITILMMAPVAAYVFLPFFRRIDATSAYEYLEKRFNRTTRLIGSAFFIFFQLGRMAIVMFLPSLALALITGLEVRVCILILGGLSLIYSTLGGVEAVIWTDTLQTFVLLGGALLSLAILVAQGAGGAAEFLAVARADDKLRLVELDWSTMSIATAALWVVVLGGFGQNLISYSSDQAIVQRYLTTVDEPRARRAIWTNGVLGVLAGVLFFAVGTALYVFYKSQPEKLDPTYQTDAIFPLFIARELPAGLAGLVVAGIFAAAQSTISTSMNSTATAVVTDFARPFDLARSDRGYLRLARWMTLLLGAAGTAAALLLASFDVRSLWDTFIGVIGLFGGPLCGLFCLGVLTRRAHGRGALLGAIAGAAILFTVERFTQVHVFLYAAVGVAASFAAGYLFSIILPAPQADTRGLTIHDR
ncbi:MAG: sodium/solute symporter [Planctomycetes bacterium]|nr:sodium/solute symporter [Planctomycetota bacterium]